MATTFSANATPDPRRWLILGTVGLAQLMVVLDATIVNIALPSAQRALGFTTVDRQWVVTAYALAFGSLLLFGGRLGDLIGRKITFLAGALGFAAASAVADPRLHHRVLGRGGHLRHRRGDLRHAVPLRPAPRLRARVGYPGRDSRPAGRHRSRRVAARHSGCRSPETMDGLGQRLRSGGGEDLCERSGLPGELLGLRRCQVGP